MLELVGGTIGSWCRRTDGAIQVARTQWWAGQIYSWSNGVTSITGGDVFNKVGNATSESIINHISTISYTFFITANEEEFIIPKVQIESFICRQVRIT